MAQRLNALPYYGGKSVRGASGTGRWIASLLPYRNAYAEPFAGMLGVLLQRRASQLEIASDADGRITNWWQCVRDRPEELAELVEWTPVSDRDWRAQRQRLDDPDPLRRALALHVVLTQGLHAGAEARNYKYVWRPGGSTRTARVAFERLRDRMRHVRLLNRDVCSILDKTADVADYVIYCDPPYQQADTSPYARTSFDRGRFVRLLQAQRGAVAVSGYGTEWDCLGWRRLEHEAQVTSYAHGYHAQRKAKAPRVEVLWVNFDAAAQETLFAAPSPLKLESA